MASHKHSLPSAPLLLLVSDRLRFGERSLEEIFLAALSGGVNMIQLREPDMSAEVVVRPDGRIYRLFEFAYQ